MTGLIDFQPKKEVCGGRDITDEQKCAKQLPTTNNKHMIIIINDVTKGYP